MSGKELFMDQRGIEKLDARIQQLRKEILIADVYSRDGKTERYNTGDEDTIRHKEILSNELHMLLDKRSRVRQVEKQDNENIIDLDDIISINYVGSNNIMVFKLVGGEGDLFKEIREISVNSPLGRAVYQKQIGDVCTYSAKDRTFTIEITEKLDLTQDETAPKR